MSAPAVVVDRPGFRYCPRCDCVKRVTEFYRSRRTGNPESGCITCRRAASRRWSAANYVPRERAR